jgi:hypothetical protein
VGGCSIQDIACVSPTSKGPFPSSDEIARRAHELFVSDGRRVALIPVYWRTAERELLDHAARRVIPANSGRTTRPLSRNKESR